jgi:hypothetical protein
MAEQNEGVPAAVAGAAAPQHSSAGSVKLPAFWSNSPANWFRSAEALFALKNITDPIDKYYLVLTSLTELQADLVSNVVEQEPDDTSYTRMKDALVANNSLTPYQMVDRLMAMEPLGGRKAIELLAAMQKLRPPKDDQFFAWAFLQRLPREVRVLLAHEDHSDMRKLAEKADGLLALHQPQIHELTAVAATTAAAIPDEDGTVAAAAGKQPQKGKSSRKKKKPGRRRSRSPADYQSPLCYFHVRYGDKAHRCEEPCAWPAGN